MYHTEGAGGGHAPDIIRVAGELICLPSSTNPTLFTTLTNAGRWLAATVGGANGTLSEKPITGYTEYANALIEYDKVK